MPFSHLGKTLIIAGILIVALGVLLIFFDRIPLLGKLPGDIRIKRGNFVFYLPIVTGVVLSIVLTIILNFVGRGK